MGEDWEMAMRALIYQLPQMQARIQQMDAEAEAWRQESMYRHWPKQLRKQ